MSLTQQTFFGASIRNFTCGVGWGTSPSTLKINLVEDPVNNDSFNLIGVGDAAYFEYGDFAFGGLVQTYKRKNSFEGYPVYEVILVDPREILDGVQLIIDGYTGSTNGIPNLYNVYGYM